jgi:hypothetical protein
LLLTKVIDLVASNDPKLSFATERLLGLMLTRGLFLPKEDYHDIVEPSIQWGFERIFQDWTGRPTLRDALEEAAFISRREAHQVIMEDFTKFIEGVNFEEKPDWFLHSAREIIIALMANPSCIEGSPQLNLALRAINRVQRSRD